MFALSISAPGNASFRRFAESLNEYNTVVCNSLCVRIIRGGLLLVSMMAFNNTVCRKTHHHPPPSARTPFETTRRAAGGDNDNDNEAGHPRGGGHRRWLEAKRSDWRGVDARTEEAHETRHWMVIFPRVGVVALFSL